MYLVPTQATLVKQTIPLLRSHGDLITTIFYRTMLSAHPDLSSIFNTANQATGRQPRALTHLILAYAENINRISELTPVFERVCQKHASLNIQPKDYDIVGKYLIQAFAAVLGPPVFTPEVEAAWKVAYHILARMLSGREEQLYNSFGQWQGFRSFKITRKVQETRTPDVFSFYLVPTDGQLPLPTFLPGQYVSLQIPIPATDTAPATVQTRQYSLSEKPRPDYYRITLKRERDPKTGPGIVSTQLLDYYNVGDKVKLSHPAGEFFLDVAGENVGTTVPLVLISAGVGVAPMMSILNATLSYVPASRADSSNTAGAPTLSTPLVTGVAGPAATALNLSAPTSSNGTRSRNHSRPESPIATSDNESFDEASTPASSTSTGPTNRPITWIHGSRGDAAFDIYIRSVVHLRSNFHSVIFNTNPMIGDMPGLDYNFSSRIDLMRLTDVELHIKHGSTEYFICGPEEFMVDAREVLVMRGVDPTRIKCELFNSGNLLERKKHM